MGNCCCTIKIISTEEYHKLCKMSSATVEHDSSVHRRERSGGSRAFEIIDENTLQLYKSSIQNSYSKIGRKSITNNRISPINITGVNNSTNNMRKSFSVPHSLYNMH